MRIVKGVVHVDLNGRDAETLITLAGYNATATDAIRAKYGDEIADRINLLLIRLWNESCGMRWPTDDGA
mgnify:CR=1 FL=1